MEFNSIYACTLCVFSIVNIYCLQYRYFQATNRHVYINRYSQSTLTSFGTSLRGLMVNATVFMLTNTVLNLTCVYGYESWKWNRVLLDSTRRKYFIYERRNPLQPLHGILFPNSSNGSVICTNPEDGTHYGLCYCTFLLPARVTRLV